MRTKIILPNLLAVLVIGLGSFFYLQENLSNKAIDQMRQLMGLRSLLYLRSEGLRGFEILSDVRAYAMSKQVVEVFDPVERLKDEPDDAYDKRILQVLFAKAVGAVESYSDRWAKKGGGKRPEIVFITDRNGVVIARNITPNACPAGRNVAMLPAMARALDSQAMYGIWSVDDSPFGTKNPAPNSCQLKNTGLLELAAAPIWHGEDVAGALVVTGAQVVAPP